MSTNDYRSPSTPLTPFTPLRIRDKNFLLEATTKRLHRSGTPQLRTVNGLLAPPQLLHLSKSPLRGCSPLSSRRRLYSPCSFMGLKDLQFEIPCRGESLAARRKQRRRRFRKLQRSYAQSHEAAAIPKTLSPRVANLLGHVGMTQYRLLFQVEEIDYDVFCTLNEQDMVHLGITDAQHRRDIYKAVLLASNLVHKVVEF